MSKQYRVLRGVEYMDRSGKKKRHEPGTVTSELPKDSLPWLIEQGHVEEIGDDKAEERERTAEVKAAMGPPEHKAEGLAGSTVIDKREGLATPPQAAPLEECAPPLDAPGDPGGLDAGGDAGGGGE